MVIQAISNAVNARISGSRQLGSGLERRTRSA